MRRFWWVQAVVCVVFWGLVIVAVRYGCWGHQGPAPSGAGGGDGATPWPTADERKQARDKQDDMVRAFAGEHNARLEWVRQLDGSGGLGRVYTEEVRRALVGDGESAIVLVGTPDDVRRTADGFSVRFSAVLWQQPLAVERYTDPLEALFASGDSSAGGDLVFELRCGPVVGAQVMDVPRGQPACFAVAAKVTAVRRVTYEVSGAEEEEVVIEASDRFVAKGDCIGILRLGSDEGINSAEGEGDGAAQQQPEQ